MTALFLAGSLCGQVPPVPPNYQALYSELQGDLTSFSSAVSAIPGQHYPVLMSAELLNANGNRGLALLGPNVRVAYLQELNALHALGVQAVVVKMGYPLLYQPFLQFNGDVSDYSRLIAFFSRVVQDVHSLGMKVIVESSSMFPGFYSTGSGANLTGYFASITYQDYLQGSAQVNANIVQSIQPDFLNVGSEPDTEVINTGFKELNSPSGWAAAINSYLSLLPTSPRIPIGAGVGTWFANGQQYIQAIASGTKVDYIDLHAYPVNTVSSFSISGNILGMISAAKAAGKRVAFSEVWLLKLAGFELGKTNTAGDPMTFSRDTFSFFEPLDQQFLTAFSQLANDQQFIYVSPFWSRYFWAYLDYGSIGTETAAQVTLASETAAATALGGGQVSATGAAYKAIIAAQAPQAAAVSAASYLVGPVAPDSIVAVFGASLAEGTGTVEGLPLPPTFGGTSASIRDSAGVSTSASFFFAAPAQANIYLPPGIASGPATLTLMPGSGSPILANIVISPVAPGLFSAGASGSGPAAATAVTLHSDGSQSSDTVFTCSGSVCSLKPLSVSGVGDQVFVSLFGTGLRNRSALANVTVKFGGTAIPATFAGAQPSYVGLDQVNALIPSSLAGSGTVNVTVSVDGMSSNSVQIQIQ